MAVEDYAAARVDRIEKARAAYLREDDLLLEDAALQEYERELASHLEQEELDWEICFRCGKRVVDKEANRLIEGGGGQWFGSWGGYTLAQLCGPCGNEVSPKRKPQSGDVFITYDIDAAGCLYQSGCFEVP